MRVRGLRKHYREVTALDGIDLDIHSGEVFALLGPNGAGKTTAVEILEGHRGRDGGEVSVLDRDPAAATRLWRTRLGIVLQRTSDAQELTVRETIRHFATYYPRPRDPDGVIEQVGLADKAGTRIRKLSGGQRRRLEVGRGIVGNPELLFLDEPTTGFDPQARRQFWELIERLSYEGTTILLTTHYLDEAEALAHRVGVIARGRILEVATPESLGGRATATTQVGWDAPEGRRTTETTTPTALVARLSAEFGGEVAGLTVTRPTLEETYLAMIGASGQPEGEQE